MRLEDLFEAETKSGTYAAARFSKESRKLVRDYISDNEVPNPVKVSKLHCTLIYSRAHVPNFEAAGKYETPIKCTVDGLRVWKTQPDDDGNTKNCLVVELKSPDFKARHKELMKKHPEATYDYPEFKTHVTLSYDIGEMQVEDFPAFEGTLYLDEEYTTPLEQNWAKKNSK